MSLNKRPAKKSALAVLKAVTKLVSSLSEEDVEAILAGRASIKLVYDNGRSTSASGLTTGVNIDTEVIKDRLAKLESTTDGFEMLQAANLTRAELERIARSLDIAILKQDSVQRLEEKLVEALIGSRLNSRAIRGK